LKNSGRRRRHRTADGAGDHREIDDPDIHVIKPHSTNLERDPGDELGFRDPACACRPIFLPSGKLDRPRVCSVQRRRARAAVQEGRSLPAIDLHRYDYAIAAEQFERNGPG
jgi:hypothetical protein